jgi:hypothetical protein
VIQSPHSRKPLASISLDLDNQWSYMKAHGDQEWQAFPSYLDVFIPQVLESLDRLELKITFFVVGRDAALEKNKELLRILTLKGHEVGNHSYSHEPWLHLYPREKIEREIAQAEEQILSTTGQRPIGFRGPGFSWSPNLLEVLAKRGYLYDASTLPMYIGPLARFYYFRNSHLSAEEKAQRKRLYGSFKDGIRPVKPYFWRLQAGVKLLEIPVTTIPIIKTPFHLSYLLFLSRFSTILMLFYLNLAIYMCCLTNTEPSFLLHPLDLLDGDQVPELGFFPGMDVAARKKNGIFGKVLRQLSKRFTLVNLSFHAQSILMRTKIRNLCPENIR